MKKIIMIFFLLIYVFLIEKVNAQTYKLTYEAQPNIYFSRGGGDKPYKSGQYPIYKFNGQIAYCIEPGKNITTLNYVATDGYINLPYSDEVKEKIELIGYYGREYPGHDNVRYSMAAQALIWELTGTGPVKFYTKINAQGEEIDIANERNEIERLISEHHNIPNLPKDVNGYYNELIQFNDVKLNDYEISDDGGNNGPKGEIYLQNGTLDIYSRIIGDSYIELTKKRYDDGKTLIFVGDGVDTTQTLGRLRYSKEITLKINLHIKGIHIKIIKVDEENNPILQSGIKFKVKNLSNNEYICPNSDCTYETNEEGYVFTDALNYGLYEVEEVNQNILNGYAVSFKKYQVEIKEGGPCFYNSKNHHYVKLFFINKKVRGKVEITKLKEEYQFLNNNLYYNTDNPLPNTTFKLYNMQDELIDTLVTNNDGYVSYDNLNLGKYYLKEVMDNNCYQEKDEKIFFEIKQDNSNDDYFITKVEVINYLKKGKLELLKIDSETKKGISNTIIGLYDENNNLLLTRETNNDGQIIIDNLPLGNYYLKEEKPNEQYKNNYLKIAFEIKKDKETIKIKMENERIYGSLEITKYQEELVLKNNKITYQKNKLKEVSFSLYDEQNNFLKNLVTDENGYVKEEKLPIGRYYLQENLKDDKYYPDKDKYYFEIKKDKDEGTNVSLEINNYLKKGKLIFHKLDKETKKGINNTIMELYNKDNELLITKETNDKGIMIINDLPYGDYYLKEKKANDNYYLSDEIIPFIIRNNQEVIEKEMENERIYGSLEINKYGEDYQFIDNNIVYQKVTLDSIVFALYNDNDYLIDVIKTGNNGYYKYDKLPLGKYYLIEKSEMNNYLINDNKYPFEIKKDYNAVINAKVDIYNYLKKGTLKFNKIDKDTQEGINNTIIEIYNEQNELLLTKETNEEGKIIINDLPIGNYYIMEKTANEKYLLTNEKIDFQINEHNEIIHKVMTNEKINFDVPKTSLDDTLLINRLFGYLMTISGGIKLHDKRKKRTF